MKIYDPGSGSGQRGYKRHFWNTGGNLNMDWMLDFL